MSPSHTPGPADVVVIGGGIMGVSTAYHLALLGAGRILLLERETMLGTGSTGRCAGGFRHQFSTEINVRLSIESVRMILAFQNELSWPIDLHQDGYLFLLSTPAEVESFSRQISLQNSFNVPSVLLGPGEIARLAPYIDLGGIVAGAYCPQDGIAEPSGMTQGYAAGARRMGAEIRVGICVRGIRTSHSRIEGVETDEGFVPCRAVVNAAGPHAREVAAWAGVDLPVYPQRRHVYTTLPFPQVPTDFLMVIEYATTFYCHRESGGILMGMGDPAEPAGFSLQVDPEFLGRLLEVALKRYPALQSVGIARSWAGLYEMTPDGHPVLGGVEHVPGFYLINGFSGHGFQHAPIAGKLVAEEVVYGRARTLDIGPLRLGRFTAARHLAESNVI